MVYDASRQRIVLFGGRTATGMMADTWVHDGVSWQQLHPSGSPPARQYHAMAYDTDKMSIVLFGGVGSTGAHLDDTWELDSATSSWSLVTPATNPGIRRDHSMVYDEAHHRVVLFGGGRPGSFPAGEDDLGDTWAYTWEGDQGVWTELVPVMDPPAPNAPLANLGTKMAYDGFNAQVLLLDAGELWAFEDTSWTSVYSGTEGAESRSQFGLAVDSSRHVLVVHGGAMSNTEWFDNTWEFDLVGNQGWLDGWQEIALPPAEAPPGRERLGMAYHQAAGIVVAFGGSTNEALGDTWAYDADVTSPWRELTSAPSARKGAVGVYDSHRGVLVVWGGIPDQEDEATDGLTWEFDGTSWTSNDSQPTPIAKVGHAMVYDEANEVVVLYGGTSSTSISELSDDAAWDGLWEYDGTGWTERDSATSPDSRAAHSMSYDASAQSIVVFGGIFKEDPDSFPIIYRDTWVYHGDHWNEQSPDPHPSRRLMQQMVYSPVRGTTVLFGGIHPWSGRFAETWEYDLESDHWTQIHTPSSPQARLGFGMTFDAARYRLLLYGGFDGDSALTDTWEFDGRSWRQRSPITSPSGPLSFMAFDQRRRRVVAFGGVLFGAASDETWEYTFGDRSVEHCGGGDDDDRDGLKDCQDPDCALVACDALACDADEACETPWVLCGSPQDQVDCTAPRCGGYPCNKPDEPDDQRVIGGICIAGECVCPWGSLASEIDCINGQDDDCNGLADCQDRKACENQPRCEDPGSLPDDARCCEYPETSCSDGFDNDGDGLVDCTDTEDCPSGEANCEVEESTCDDGFDNDGNGNTDCWDSSCFTDPVCPSAIQF